MSDRTIINYIKQNSEIYPIFQVIANIQSTDMKLFNTKAKTIETLKTIFESSGFLHEYTLSSIKDITYDGINITSFYFNERDYVGLLYVLIDYINRINENFMSENGICITSASFSSDDSSYIVFAVSEVNSQDFSENVIQLRSKLEEYLKNKVGIETMYMYDCSVVFS